MTPLALLLASWGAAQAAGAPGAPAPPVTDGRERLLVLDPRGAALDAETRTLLTAALAQEIDKRRAFVVLSTAELRQLAEMEANKQLVGCDTDGCMAELGDALGARFVVFGDAARVGTASVVNYSLFDVKTNETLRRTSVQIGTRGDIPAAAVAAAEGLLPRGRAVPVWSWIAGGVGGGVLILGATFDAVSPTSNNGRLDAGDFGGAVVMVAGFALLGAGVVGAIIGEAP